MIVSSTLVTVGAHFHDLLAKLRLLGKGARGQSLCTARRSEAKGFLCYDQPASGSRAPFLLAGGILGAPDGLTVRSDREHFGAISLLS